MILFFFDSNKTTPDACESSGL